MRTIFSKVPLRQIISNLFLTYKNVRGSLLGMFIGCFLCFAQLLLPSSASSQGLSFSYSYFNITRNVGGGTLETGDIIEVHALVYVPSGTKITNVYFIAPINVGTQYVPNSLKLITNEAVPMMLFTDASGDDGGAYDASKPAVRINISTQAPTYSAGKVFSGATFYSQASTGTVTGGTDIPKAAGGTLGIIAYQLKVTANFGDIINPTGTFYYSDRYGKNPTSQDFQYAGIKIVQNQGLCPNFSSASFTAESSFGSGNTQNRPAGVNAPGYTKKNISTNQPDDNYYAVVNNTSSDGTTNNGVPYKGDPGGGSSSRVFGGAWDIIGDHTNAVNPALGNPPVPPGTTGGYMLLVNAAIPTGVVYIDTIKNLCPNTYYEFSAWIRNICGSCGSDYTGTQYPRPNNHGVKPNLTYAINGIDYYTTGNIDYTATWVKRGFIYKTGLAESSFVISIKNNASGGDGNDWVLDDINLSTCYPNLIMNPNDTAVACAGYPITITDTVKSYYNNYGNYQWEASNDGGLTWLPVMISGGSVVVGADPHSITPVLVNGLYQYHVDAAFTPRAADSGFYFRLKVATTASNLSDPNCSVDKSQKVFLKVYNTKCNTLETHLLNFSGTVINNKNTLHWITQNDEHIEKYQVEKSTDGVHFSRLGIINSGNDKNGGNYTFTDAENSSSTNYYRLKLISINNSPVNYSKTIMLYNKTALFKVSAVNPFNNNLKIDVSMPEQGKIEMNLYDMYGKILNKKNLQLNKGNSQVIFDNLSGLPSGMYILSSFYNGAVVQNKLIKTY